MIRGFVCLFAAAAHAQSGFDAVSVKRSQGPVEHSGVTLSRHDDGTKLTIENETLRRCIARAFNVRESQIVGPEWMNDERYNVLAKSAEPIPNERVWELVQGVLAERFKLAAHRETRTLQIYELVPAKDGPKLKVSAEPAGKNGTWRTRNEAGLTIKAANKNIPDLAEILTGALGVPVIDKTGLSGGFDFELTYARDSQPAETGPSISSAVQSQLGLKLEGRKGPVEVLVVDRVEKVPVEN